jgi:hypothetical protein
VGGNKTMAARVLGFDRRTLYRKLDAYAEGKKAPKGAAGRSGVYPEDASAIIA